MAYQTKLIEEGSDASLQNISMVFTFISKWGNKIKIQEDFMRRLISEQILAEFMSTSVASNLFAGGTLHYIQHLRRLKDEEIIGI